MMKSAVALLIALIGMKLSAGGAIPASNGVAAAQPASSTVTITLVRWPFT